MRTRDSWPYALLCVAGVALAAPGQQSAATGTDPPPSAATRALKSQSRALTRTEDLLVATVDSRRKQLRTRVQAAYKALRASSPAPPWAAEVQAGGARVQARAWQRLGVRRVLARDVRELALVRAELTHLHKARETLAERGTRAAELAELGPDSLRNPVAFSRVLEPFGSYRHSASKARLSRRGVVLSSRAGRNVRAVAPGRVRYVGEVRGLGTAALVDHGQFWSLSGPLFKLSARLDTSVATGDILGESPSDRVYFEVRMATGGPGVPVDPVPLINW